MTKQLYIDPVGKRIFFWMELDEKKKKGLNFIFELKEKTKLVSLITGDFLSTKADE